MRQREFGNPVQTRLEFAVEEKLRVLARKEGSTRSEVIRRMVTDALNKIEV